MTQTIDKDGRATLAAAAGKGALDRGDFLAARRGYRAAGTILEAEMEAAPNPGPETWHVSWPQRSITRLASTRRRRISPEESKHPTCRPASERFCRNSCTIPDIERSRTIYGRHRNG
jgi:hypothetical protein